YDPARHLDRRAERTGILVRTFLEVELDVLLAVEIDPELGERDLEGRDHGFGGKGRVPVGAAPCPSEVPAGDLAQADPDARPEEAVACLLPQVLRLDKQAAALFREVVEGKAKAAVQVCVVRGAESTRLALDDPRGLQLEGIQVLLRELVSGRLDPCPDVAVLFVSE